MALSAGDGSSLHWALGSDGLWVFGRGGHQTLGKAHALYP